MVKDKDPLDKIPKLDDDEPQNEVSKLEDKIKTIEINQKRIIKTINTKWSGPL